MTGNALKRLLMSGPVLRTWLFWHDREFLVRPLADLLRRSWDIEVHEMTAEETTSCTTNGIHCEASFCWRACTHVVQFNYRGWQGKSVIFRSRRTQVLIGETFLCSKAARRYVRHRGLLILPPFATLEGSCDA